MDFLASEMRESRDGPPSSPAHEARPLFEPRQRRLEATFWKTIANQPLLKDGGHMKRFFQSLLALSALAVASIVVLPSLVSSDWIRGELSRQLSAATGSSIS
ncbi:hypothetical protein I6F26_33305, partial [Ensifer sp. IC3342]|nr:hypothetical protein [Ensifer sp. BRP08]MCA1451303.1 hypothetical protein [Ensifer sp. IC3342]